MYFCYEDNKYPIIIEKKMRNKNTYLRVNAKLEVKITTNTFVSDKVIKKFIEDNYEVINKMIDKRLRTKEFDNTFSYLGKTYEPIITNDKNVVLGETKVFLPKEIDLNKWYKKQASTLFLERLDYWYNLFTYKIPYPSLKIRKMTSRWGVCNNKLKTVTLNLELIKRDISCLDYVIVHELSHFIEPNHSDKFWKVVENNYPNYKNIRKQMRNF